MAAARVICGLLMLTMIIGCSDDLAAVTGTVTFDGEPIVGSRQVFGTVSFYRDDGSGAPAVGFIDEAGRYTLRTGARKGLQPGTYLVGIAVKKINPPSTPDGMPHPTLITPARYASIAESGLRQVVKPGRNTCDFALASERDL